MGRVAESKEGLVEEDTNGGEKRRKGGGYLQGGRIRKGGRAGFGDHISIRKGSSLRCGFHEFSIHVF